MSEPEQKKKREKKNIKDVKERKPREKKDKKIKSRKILIVEDEPSMDKQEVGTPQTILDRYYEELESVPSETKKYDIKKEELESTYLQDNKEFEYLYPSLNDPNFNVKIAEKKEFFDTKYDGEIKDVTKEGDRLCNAEFELSPHQIFIRNFLSFQTPYNSILLYHGLGTGKTCSAITVAEEMREYIKQVGISQKIIVVASPNVQENFKLQLFDENKLKLIDGVWNIKSCTGNKFLKEINPTNMKGLNKEKVISQIKQIIHSSYMFLGYVEFANYIEKQGRVEGEVTDQVREKISKIRLNNVFNNQLIIIDEVHNIRITDDNANKRVAMELFKLVNAVDNLKLLLLSATPMYNSYKEIIWLLNLMNLNDNRPTIDIKNVFRSDGSFVTDERGREIGKDLLERKSRGYISFLRGENPYVFPYRIWPSNFSLNNSFKSKKITYPTQQYNGKPVLQPLELIDVYVNEIGEYQQRGYEYVVRLLKKRAEEGEDELPSFENMEAKGYTMLQKSIQSLNMIYPDERLDRILSGENILFDTSDIIGSNGMNRIMKYTESTNPHSKKDFKYKTDKYGEIFSPNEIGKYSSKIKTICDNILNSTGIVLVFSEYIDGGLVPVALALESLGFTKYGTSSLFKTPPTKVIDATEFKPKEQMPSGKTFKPAKYAMITGDAAYSPDNVNVIKTMTSSNNVYGEEIKVILISKTGAEGIDLTNIRQVHIMEPWYNMNRIEQIIGRAVRNCSHKSLPFEERNVQIFLYGTLLSDSEQEAVDLYVYRLAEIKALQIGRVSRVLKENAVDCILNYEQQNFTEENMRQIVQQHLSNKKTIDYAVGDKPFSSICDYMDSCQYKCSKDRSIDKPKLDTFTESFIIMNTEKIIHKIKDLFKDKHFYTKQELISRINITREYPLIQINSALNQLVEDNTEYVSDIYGRLGNVINIDNLYLFQPIELDDNHISLYERSVPVQFKHNELSFKLPDDLTEAIIHKPKAKEGREKQEEQELTLLINEIEAKYNLSTTHQVVEKGEDNWYKICSVVIEKMTSEEIERNYLIKFLIAHIAETLLFKQTILLLNYLYNPESELSDILRLMKKYYDDIMLIYINKKGLITQKEGKQQLIIYDGEEWINAESEDYQDFANEIRNIIDNMISLSNIVGFIGIFKNDYLIFKIKFMNIKRHKGARCDQAGKIETIKNLNKILESDVFNAENTKGIGQIELCIRQEFTLRYYDSIKKERKRWFLSPIEGIIKNIEKITL
jgi:superfamily II DNA or RNA helicase